MPTRLPATTHRVERASSRPVNQLIRARTEASVAHWAGATDRQIDERLRQLDAEWDTERALETNASGVGLAGLLLGVLVDRRFLLVPAGVLGFLAQHALQGWCPPLPLLRRMGVRTAREIERERLALKALRGDFEGIPRQGDATPGERARHALAAADA